MEREGKRERGKEGKKERRRRGGEGHEMRNHYVIKSNKKERKKSIKLVTQ